MAGKRYTLVLNFGYVESARLAFMPWVCNETFKDAKAALLDLAQYLKKAYLDSTTTKEKKCCTATYLRDGEAEFCAKCGTRLADKGFDGEEFSDWLRGLDTDIDTFNGYIDWDHDNRWQAGDLEDSPNQRFVYQAEWVLAAALGHSQREDVTFETICKRRTKSKQNSFSFY